MMTTMTRLAQDGSRGRLPAQHEPRPAVRVTLPALAGPALLYRGHTDAVSSLCWSPDSTRIASCSWDGSVRVWEVGTGGEVLAPLDLGIRLLRLAWSPDERFLVAVGEEGGCCAWQAGDTCPPCMGGPWGGVREVAFSPDGGLLALGGGEGAVELRVVTGDGGEWGIGSAFCLPLVMRVPCGGSGARPVSNRVCALAFSPDGERLAVGGLDETVEICDARTGAGVLTRSGSSQRIVISLAWAPNGRCIAQAATERWLRVWSAVDGDILWQAEAATGWVKRVDWAPGGGRLASACDDGTVQVREAASGRMLCAYRAQASLGDALAWSPDGRLLASAGADGTVLVAEVPG
jgi:WD40 repeat protein